MPPLPDQRGNNPNIGSYLSYGFVPNVSPSHLTNIQTSHIGWLIQNETINIENDRIKSEIEIPCQAIMVPDEDMPIYHVVRNYIKSVYILKLLGMI